MGLKAWTIVAFVLLALIDGAVGQYFYPDQMYPQSDLWFMPVFVFLIFLWYRLDSNERSYKRSPWLSVSVVAIAAIGLPYYLFRTRGFKRGLIAVVLALLVLLANAVMGIVGQYSVYALRS